MHLMVHIKLVLMAFFWGTAFVAGRVLSQDLPPLTIAFYRFALSLLIFLPMMLMKEGWPKLSRKHWLMCFVGSFWNLCL